MGKRVFIFDLDGTTTDARHRQHFLQKTPRDWKGFLAACGSDPPMSHVVELVIILSRTYSPILFVTARPFEYESATRGQLRNFGIPGDTYRLYMRPNGDYRPDAVVKEEILDRILAEGFEPIMAFDDRDSVVAMWRRRGIPCAQVAPDPEHGFP